MSALDEEINISWFAQFKGRGAEGASEGWDREFEPVTEINVPVITGYEIVVTAGSVGSTTRPYPAAFGGGEVHGAGESGSGGEGQDGGASQMLADFSEIHLRSLLPFLVCVSCGNRIPTPEASKTDSSNDGSSILIQSSALHILARFVVRELQFLKIWRRKII